MTYTKFMENWKERRKRFLQHVKRHSYEHGKNVTFGTVGDKIGVGFRLCDKLSFNFKDVSGTAVYWVKSESIWCELITVEDYFECLYKQGRLINDEFKRLGYKLVWDKVDDRQLHRIRVSRNAYLEKEDKWDEYAEWLTNLAEIFKDVFPKYLKNCNFVC